MKNACITSDRIIHGTVNAKTLIVPEQGACGSPYPEQIDWLVSISRKDTYITSKLVILSKRNYTRVFANFKQMYDISIKLAERFGLQRLQSPIIETSTASIQKCMRRDSSTMRRDSSAWWRNVHVLALSEGSTLIEIMDVMDVEMCFLRLAVYKNMNYYDVNSIKGNVDLNSLRDVCIKYLTSKHIDFTYYKSEVGILYKRTNIRWLF